jgi:hypothetical protein
MGLQGSDRALMYALGALARGAATRGGYVSQLPLIAIGGDWTGPTAARRVLIASLTISDLLNDTPNTCTFTVQGARPTEGADIVIGKGSTAASSRLFGGTILRVTEVIAGQNPTNPRNLLYQCEGIDYSWRLTATLVSARYRSQSATAIALDLLARFAPPGYGSMIAAGLPDVDEITFTNTTLLECFGQLAGRIGGYAKCDYFRRVWVWTDLDDALVPPPRPLTADHPSLEDVAYVRDLSPVITRALVEGGGVNAIEECDPGETRIPIEDPAWYSALGGYVVSGPQRIRYAGIVDGGGGAMASQVGGPTGSTAPSAPPTIGSAAGAGLPLGVYGYVYTWVTAQGESLPSPPYGWAPPAGGGPTTAPGATPASGAGLGTGTYKYAYTWTTAVGETTPSPLAAADTSTSTVAAPAGGLTPTVQQGGGLPDGTYKYAVTFTTGAGETTPGPQNAAIPHTNVNTFPTPPAPRCDILLGSGLPASTWEYHVSYVTANGEAPGPGTRVSWSKPGAASVKVYLPPGPAGTTARRIYRSSEGAPDGPWYGLGQINNNDDTFWTDTYVIGSGTMPGSNTAGSTTPYQQVALSAIPIGPAGVTGRKIYRTANNGSQLKLLQTIGNNTATTAGTDTTPDASLGANAPTTNTTTITAKQVQVSGIAAGPAGVTGRKIYRTAVGGSALKFLATLANNTTTTYTDATPDASLGAAPPTAGTVSFSQATVSDVAIGAVGTTARRIYRTPVGGGAIFKALATITNNTATALAAPDTTPDASLGAAAPTTDTSGLPSGGAGQVNAGAATIPVASVAPFLPEGWAIVGGQLIRYHGTNATPPQITGIPPIGVGSLGVSIPYNSPIKIVSQLTGVPASGAGAIVETILQGDPVNLLVIHDDVEAQAILAALLGGTADGVVEYYDQDRRISLVEASARADAWLALKSRTLETVRYRVRDPRTQSGATVTVDLPAIGVAGAFEIQEVTIGGFLGVPDVNPTYTVVASSSRLTFDDLVRRLRRPGASL